MLNTWELLALMPKRRLALNCQVSWEEWSLGAPWMFSILGRAGSCFLLADRRSLPQRAQRCNASGLFPARPCSQLPDLPEETEAGRLPRGSDSAGVTR